MTRKLIISGETVYPCNGSHPGAGSVISAAHEASDAGYQLFSYLGKIYAIGFVKEKYNHSLYTFECEIDEPEYVAELTAEFNRIHGIQEQP